LRILKAENMYQIVTHVDQIDWTPLEIKNVAIKVLHKNDLTGAMSIITKIDAGATIPAHSHTLADETVYVLQGDFIEDGQSYAEGSVFFGKAKAIHGPHSTISGCVLLTNFSAELDFVF